MGRARRLSTMHRASIQKQDAVEITRALLGAGAGVHARDHEGSTALHWALYAACVDLLVDAGADLEARDKAGVTPVFAAVPSFQRGSYDVVLRLADRGADLVNTGGEPGLVLRKVEELRAKRSRAHPG